MKQAGTGLAAVVVEGAHEAPHATGIGMRGWSVPGKQTVPRAEVFGLIKAQEAKAQEAPTVVKIGIDASYVTNALAPGPKGELARVARRAGANGDLWAQVGEGPTGAEVAKVKAHTAWSAVVGGRQTITEYVGNHLADIACGVAAEMAQARGGIIEWVEQWTTRAYLAALRLAYVEAALWKREGLPKLVPKPVLKAVPPEISAATAQDQLNQRQRASGHKMVKLGRKSWRCARCLGYVSKASAWPGFLLNPCGARQRSRASQEARGNQQAMGEEAVAQRPPSPRGG